MANNNAPAITSGPSSTAGLQQSPLPVTETQVKALKECINESIVRYKKKQRRNKFGAIFIHIATILLTVSTTILLGWKYTDDKDTGIPLGVKNIAFVLSTCVAGISALNTVFDYRVLWLGYSIAGLRLRSLLSKLKFLESSGLDTITQEKLNELFAYYEDICNTMEKDYKNIRSSQ